MKDDANMSKMKAAIQRSRPDLTVYEALYKRIHANPELSHQESETAALITQHLQRLSPDFEIRNGIGGHGLIAILRSGEGKIIMLRADMDALPVAERTNLEYASSRRQVGSDGKETPVMHGQRPQHCVTISQCIADSRH